MRRKTIGLMIVAVMVVIGTLLVTGIASAAPLSNPLPGAIFTTLPDGSVVNGNVKEYDDKCDVALNGGPSGPQSHHLPDGDYDVAVTDPSGKTELGVGAVTISNGEGTFGPTSLCDLVQPSPYDTTPNNGGEYKAWLCVSGQLYVNNSCKTDNFKVRLSEPLPEPTPTLMPTPAVTSSPTPTPTATSVVQPPETTPTPEPRMPVAFPDSGGEPLDEERGFTRNDLLPVGLTTILVGAGLILDWKRHRIY